MVHIYSKINISLRFQAVENASPIDAHAFAVNQVEFSPCGKYVASCSADGSAVLWDTEASVIKVKISEKCKALSFCDLICFICFSSIDWQTSTRKFWNWP